MDQTFCNNFKVNQTRVQVFVSSFEQLVKCFEQIKFIICVLNYFPSILCNNAELTQLLALAMNLSDISLLPGSHLQLLHPERCVLSVAWLAGPGEAGGGGQPRAGRGDGRQGGAAPPEAAGPGPAEAEGVRGALQGRGLPHGELQHSGGFIVRMSVLKMSGERMKYVK